MSPAADFRIFDVHHHFTSLADTRDGGLTPEEHLERDLRGRIAEMDRLGVAQAAIGSNYQYLRPGGITDTRRVNDAALAYARRAPDRFPVVVGVAEPHTGEPGLAEIDRCAAAGLKAMSLHARFQGTTMDSYWVTRTLERTIERGLVPMVHANADSKDEAPWKLEPVARAHPQTTFILLDPFTDGERPRELLHLAERCPNLVFDTALAVSWERIEPMVRTHGPERVLFGSLTGSGVRAAGTPHILGQILEAHLDNAAKRAILGDNARRIFGIS